MHKTKSDILRKFKWALKLKNKTLNKTTRRRCVVYLTALASLFSNSDNASAKISYGDSPMPAPTEAKLFSSSQDLVTKDLSGLSMHQTFEYFNISELSLKDLRNFNHQSRMRFTVEELRAMSPGPLAKTLLEQARKKAKGKKCYGRCFSKVKDVLFKAEVRRQLRTTDDSYLPAKRWETLSAYQGEGDMATLPQFICCEIEHENMADVPDGSVFVFSPSRKHPYGHIAFKDGGLLLSDGEEILANISKTKYSGVVAFIPVDNTISPSAVHDSPCLEAYCDYMKMKNVKINIANSTLAGLQNQTKPPSEIGYLSATMAGKAYSRK